MWPPSRMCGRQRRVIRIRPWTFASMHPLLVLLGRLPERVAAERAAGVVDEDVDPAERLERGVDERLAAVRVGDVERVREVAVEQLDAPGADGDLHPRLLERPRRRRADAAGRAGDDRDLAVERAAHGRESIGRGGRRRGEAERRIARETVQVRRQREQTRDQANRSVENARLHWPMTSAADESGRAHRLLATQEENRALSDQWRALRRAATFVAVLSAPAVFIWLWKHAGLERRLVDRRDRRRGLRLPRAARPRSSGGSSRSRACSRSTTPRCARRTSSTVAATGSGARLPDRCVRDLHHRRLPRPVDLRRRYADLVREPRPSIWDWFATSGTR